MKNLIMQLTIKTKLIVETVNNENEKVMLQEKN